MPRLKAFQLDINDVTGNMTLDSIGDIDTAGSPAVQDGDILVWDNAAQLWKNKPHTVPGVTGLMKWKGIWADGTYNAEDVVRDGIWTMVANTTTTERAAPQLIGDLKNAVDPTDVFTTGSDSSVIKMYHKYTFLQTGFVKYLQFRVPEWGENSISRITVNNVTLGTSVVVENPILANDEWVTFNLDPTPVAASTVYEIIFEFFNSNPANNINGIWKSNIGTGVPVAGQFNIDSVSNPTVIEIYHTDDDSIDHSTELDAVSVGSAIYIREEGDINRSVQARVTAVDTTAASSTKYTCTLISVGSKNIRDNKKCVVDVDVIATATKFSKITNYYSGSPQVPEFATVTTDLFFNGVSQVTGSPSTATSSDTYGINVGFQEAYVSPDWELVARSDSSTYNKPPTEYYIDITTVGGSPGFTISALPYGWTVAYNSTGSITVTHNLGDVTIGLALNVVYSGSGRALNPTSITANAFTLQIRDMADTAVEGRIAGKVLL